MHISLDGFVARPNGERLCGKKLNHKEHRGIQNNEHREIQHKENKGIQHKGHRSFHTITSNFFFYSFPLRKSK